MDDRGAIPLTVGNAVREMSRAFSRAGIETYGLDARLLTAHVTGTGRDLSIIDPGFELNPEFEIALADVTARRLAGEPVHRIIGRREFYGLDLLLGPDTLEPRPDTETLVDAVIPFVVETIRAKGNCRVLDLGTGTGAIGLAIVSQLPGATVLGADKSAGAVKIANENAQALGLASRFFAVRSDWFADISGMFDLVISNPPYIPAREIETLDPGVRDHDPRIALDGGEDGLDAYRAIARDAGGHLAESGHVALEIGAGQADAVQMLFKKAGYFFFESKCDITGTKRAVIFKQEELFSR
jgi:release factor glutamine methyltransferase